MTNEEMATKLESFESDLLVLVRAARKVSDSFTYPGAGKDAIALRNALDQFEPWLDNDQDPRSMGWVDSKGRP